MRTQHLLGGGVSGMTTRCQEDPGGAGLCAGAPGGQSRGAVALEQEGARRSKTRRMEARTAEGGGVRPGGKLRTVLLWVHTFL